MHKLNRFEEAIQNFDHAIKKHPEDHKIFLNKGDSLLLLNLAITLDKLKKFEEALKCYD